MLDSELLLVALLACLSVMVLTSVWKQRSLQGKLPPGPTALHIIENVLQLEKNEMYNSLLKVTPGREVGGTGGLPRSTVALWHRVNNDESDSEDTFADFTGSAASFSPEIPGLGILTP
uniref:Uncharacterized protein n=1 Tax=Sciurus vulgaris TaxID=55149 RepID=A0A8D2DH23_SCIVU